MKGFTTNPYLIHSSNAYNPTAAHSPDTINHFCKLFILILYMLCKSIIVPIAADSNTILTRIKPITISFTQYQTVLILSSILYGPSLTIRIARQSYRLSLSSRKAIHYELMYRSDTTSESLTILCSE